MPELIAVLIILGVIGAVAGPSLVGSRTNEVRLYHQTVAALRYARNSALAMQRVVCVSFSATSLSMQYASAYGSSTCDTNLRGPDGSLPYSVTANGSAQFSPTPAGLNFTIAGKPSGGALSINIASYGTAITVEAETGYVH